MHTSNIIKRFIHVYLKFIGAKTIFLNNPVCSKHFKTITLQKHNLIVYCICDFIFYVVSHFLIKGAAYKGTDFSLETYYRDSNILMTVYCHYANFQEAEIRVLLC